jgi:NAD(P)-dependent dehydrogenase (short-subunit alcohol dehydrogenase family)
VFDVAAADKPKANGLSLERRTFVVSEDGGGVAERLVGLLERAGARARVLAPGEEAGAVDGLVYLGSIRGRDGAEPAKELFDLARQVLEAGARWVYGVTGLGGGFGRRAGNGAAGGNGMPRGGGVAGLLKVLTKELPDLKVRAIDVDPTEDPQAIAEAILGELTASDKLVEVGYRHGVRQTLRLVAAEPAAVRPELPLGPESVVLVTGGARGITAAAAIELARRTRCRLELVGRSPLPGEEDPALAAASDTAALRRTLVERGAREPAAIEADCRRVLAAREIRQTLAALAAAGSPVRYHSLDVRDEQAVSALIDEIYERHGRLDGVVHGAGIIEDKLLRHKTRESFDRVFDTKVAAARALVRKLRDDVGFVVFFSSVSGAFGNRGQADYAAASDALDKLALELAGRIPGRAISINWGPWAGAGMVSEELQREYGRRGIGLIPPREGVARLIAELCATGGDPQVVLMCADAESMA